MRAFHEQGLSYKETAALLGVGEATVSRVLRRHRETGGVEPRPRRGGNRSPIAGSVLEALRQLAIAIPNATVTEFKRMLEQRTGVTTSRSSVQRALSRLGFTKKKLSFMAEEVDRPDVQERRRWFDDFLTGVDHERLVFLDESYCSTSMVRDCGWAPRGSRAHGRRPFRSWRSISLVGAIRLGKRPKLMTHPGSVNGEAFLHFIKQRLCPWLNEGDLVVMDNFSTHKMTAVRDALATVGAEPLFLPPYSPDLNPIELLWADMKRDLRRIAARTEDDLRKVARALRAAVPVAKIRNWFHHCIGGQSN